MGQRQLEDPVKEQERIELIIQDEMEGITKIPPAAITKDYLLTVAHKTGASHAALWATFRRLRWPIKPPAQPPQWTPNFPRPPTISHMSIPEGTAADQSDNKSRPVEVTHTQRTHSSEAAPPHNQSAQQTIPPTMVTPAQGKQHMPNAPTQDEQPPTEATNEEAEFNEEELELITSSEGQLEA